uniref:Uncharacterized protein n=1 Tax=Anopheles melas TaxID=34690 RepID=A0A182U841_9DIPT
MCASIVVTEKGDFDLVDPPGLPESFDLSSRLPSPSECCGLGFGDVSCVCGSFGPLKLIRLPLGGLALLALAVPPAPPFTVLGAPDAGGSVAAAAIPRSGRGTLAPVPAIPVELPLPPPPGRKLLPPVLPFGWGPLRTPTVPPSGPAAGSFPFAAVSRAAPPATPTGWDAPCCCCCFGETLPRPWSSSRWCPSSRSVSRSVSGSSSSSTRASGFVAGPPAPCPINTSVSSAKSGPATATGLEETGEEESLQDGPDTPTPGCSPFDSVPVSLAAVGPVVPASGLPAKSSLARVRGIQIGERLGPVPAPPPLPAVPTVPLPTVPSGSGKSPVAHRLPLSNVFRDWLPLASSFDMLGDEDIDGFAVTDGDCAPSKPNGPVAGPADCIMPPLLPACPCCLTLPTVTRSGGSRPVIGFALRLFSESETCPLDSPSSSTGIAA